jgi:nitrous oxidase accessory protein NosD
MRWITILCACIVSTALFADVIVKSGESIQKAIDAAADGSTIVVEAGTYPEHLNITKALTLRGAGSDKTILEPKVESVSLTDAQKIDFANRLLAEKNEERQLQIVADFLRHPTPPTIGIQATAGVTISGLRVRAPAPNNVGVMGNDSIININGGKTKITDCVILGPCMNGVTIANAADCEISHSLIAACWGTGVVIAAGDRSRVARTLVAAPLHVQIVESDVRNCYYAGMTIHAEGVTVERCRVSGAAWHGIRYDNCSPTITDCAIFANARCGIYASGKTHGTIRGNVFWKNEMDGVSCWFDNTDVVDQNTFVANLREGAAILGNAKPTLSDNLFVNNPVAMDQNQIADRNGGGGAGDPQPTLRGNQFWKNPKLVQRMQKDEPVPDGSLQTDPKLANEAALDFTPADANGPGAHHAAAIKSPWEILPEEKSIIPDTDTRDYQQWKKPAGMR